MGTMNFITILPLLGNDHKTTQRPVNSNRGTVFSEVHNEMLQAGQLAISQLS
jgi:hypothetical protein